MGATWELDLLVPEGKMATHGHRVILLRASVPERMAWCSKVLAAHPPRLVRLSPLDQAALEAVLADLAGRPLEAWPIAVVGRVAAVGYRPVFINADPVITVAFPLLSLPLYRDAVRRMLREEWGWNWETWRLAVEGAAEDILRAAPGRLTVPELAFALLGTLHRLADPPGSRWARMLAEWSE